MPNVEVVNIVASLDLYRELDLSAVADLLESSDVVSKVKYSPAENHWLQTRFEQNGESKYVAFYRSGKCALVGCDSFERIDKLVEVVKNELKPVIRDPPTLKIKNLVCVGELDQQLDLTHVAIAAGLENVEYEPEQFPGLIYRGGKSNSVILVFASGKIVITGITTIESANQSFQSFTKNIAEWGLRD